MSISRNIGYTPACAGGRSGIPQRKSGKGRKDDGVKPRRGGICSMDFNTDSFKIFDREWALLTAGTIDRYNTMTVSWGGLGTLWGKPVATVYVKPVRFTHEFMEANEFFTVSFYPEKYRRALALLGSLSGRDGDKVARAGLTPKSLGHAVTFGEARATLICRKIYRQDLYKAAMPRDVVAAYYAAEAPHTMYIGEVTGILR